jgi:hypothetical protein
VAAEESRRQVGAASRVGIDGRTASRGAASNSPSPSEGPSGAASREERAPRAAAEEPVISRWMRRGRNDGDGDDPDEVRSSGPKGGC